MTVRDILLVEDDPDHVELFRLNLSETIYRASRLVVKGSLRAGLDHLEAAAVDIVFLDLGLPDSRLQETIERLPGLTERHPVVVTTSLDHGPLMLDLINRGAEECVPKLDLRPALLERVIRYALDRFSQRAFTKAVLQSVAQPVVYVGERAKVLGCNPAFEELVGRAEGELIGEDIDAVAPAPLSRLVRGFDVASGRALEAEIELDDVRGRAREGVLFVRPIVRARAHRAGTVATFVDLTERRRLARELRRQEQIRFDSLSVLAGGIAHEFNNRLMVISGHAALIAEDTEPGSELNESAQEIEGAVRVSAERVRQLMAYAGYSSHRSGQVVQLGHVVQLVLRDLGSLEDQDARMHHVSAGLATVRGESDGLQLVVRCLLQNALESYEGAPREVEICTSARTLSADELGAHDLEAGRRCAVLDVRDWGRGMDAEALSRAFEPFFTTKGAGRGLSLSAARGVVMRHHGQIHLDSTPGEGTLARVILPLWVGD